MSSRPRSSLCRWKASIERGTQKPFPSRTSHRSRSTVTLYPSRSLVRFDLFVDPGSFRWLRSDLVMASSTTTSAITNSKSQHLASSRWSTVASYVTPEGGGYGVVLVQDWA
jgi:hypothetical protein